MSDYPKITIITPSLNQGQFLEETICSVLNQNYPNLEYILIDGGSTDNTKTIIEKYKRHFSYWVSEKDSGQSEAINKGLQLASGDIITWLNSDDTYVANTLKFVSKTFNDHPSLAFLHGNTELFGDNIKTQITAAKKNLNADQYLSTMKIAQPSSFFSKLLLDQTGILDQRLHYAMDFDLVSKAILLGFEFLYTDQLLSRYRIHEHSKSNDDQKFLEEWSLIFLRTLISLEAEAELIQMYRKLVPSIAYANPKPLVVLKKFTDHQIRNAFLEHMHLHFHFNYRLGNNEAANRIAMFIEQFDFHFYKKQSFSKYRLRMKWIPAPLFKILRSIR